MIIHIITGLNVGGAEITLLKLLRFSKHRNCLVISLTNKIELEEKFRELEIPVIVLKFNKYNFFVQMLKLYRLLKYYKPDIVQTWLYHSDFFGGVAAYAAGVKKIFWNIRTTELRKGSKATAILRRILAGLSYIIPSKIVVVGERARLLHQCLGYNKSKFVLIPNGYHSPDAQPNTSMECDSDCGLRHFSTKDFIIGTVGRYSSVKGHDVLVRAAAIVCKSRNNVKFVLIGRGLTKDNIELMNLIEQENVSEKFILLGERLDLNALYARMDLFVLPSRSEGFPNALAEAIVHGVPAISTDVGDAESIVGKHTPLIQPDDFDGLASRILEYAKMEQGDLKFIGDNMRKHVLANYGTEKMVHRYCELYNLSYCRSNK